MFEKKKKGISGMAKKDTYDAGSISVLEGLEALQDRDTARIISVFFCHSTDSFLFLFEHLFVLYQKFAFS